MTEYNGQTITYDRIGNPLTYRDGMTMTWKRGRQLTTLQTAENSIQYKYDSDSIRTSKIVDGVVHTYEYLDGMLMHETRGEQAYDYYYDANGQLYAVSYKLSENDTKKVYYFTHNWCGDIVGIYNGNGDLKATYEYDAWGNVTAIEDANGNAIDDETHIANLNPFRYRGYYMDTETGLYYLMSRYYDPVTHRFVNADGYFQSGGDILDTNMNAYCRNNPVNYFDPTGDACEYHGRFYVPNCVYCSGDRRDHLNTKQGIDYFNQINGTNYIGVGDDGEFINPSVGDQVLESAKVLFYSGEIELDAGFGFGGEINVAGIVKFEGVAKFGLISIQSSPRYFDIGSILYAGGGISMPGLKLPLGCKRNFLSWITEEETVTYQEPASVGFSASAYFGIGGTVDVRWNLEYLANELYRIWS